MKQSNIVSMGDINRKQVGGSKKWLWKLSLGLLVFLLGAIFILTVVPAAFPAVGATMADFLRATFGPQPVAVLESVSSRLHDTMSRHLYQGSAPQIQWSASAPAPLKQSSPSVSPHQQTQQLTTKKAKEVDNSITLAAPELGWQVYGPVVNGSYVMARTLVTPDPYRPYAGVALVRMDLSKLQLHMEPGYQEPSHSIPVVQAFPNLGTIPTSDQQTLIAAFNGGFKTVNGHYGMMVNGVTLLPARPNMGTVGIYRDGHVQIGMWGKDILPSADLIAYRQNCPPLIEAGALNPDLQYDNRNEWGYTGNTDITWRTGLGITHDGRYLIYAVGNGTSAMTLAQVLQQAGAYSAIQLDINQYYAHFDTYQPVNSSTAQGPQLVAQRLLDKMINQLHIYVTPNARDFFYLTAK